MVVVAVARICVGSAWSFLEGVDVAVVGGCGSVTPKRMSVWTGAS